MHDVIIIIIFFIIEHYLIISWSNFEEVRSMPFEGGIVLMSVYTFSLKSVIDRLLLTFFIGN